MASIDEAYEWCRQLASSHYENFPVASVLVPRRLRKHMTALYAFSRLGDDIADADWPHGTSHDAPRERHQALNFMESALRGEIDTTGHPVFMALHDTMVSHELPSAPFSRLLLAFKSDVYFSPLTTWDDVFAYCHQSADPVGEIILRMDGSASDETIALSNDICTALQITNFIQDVDIDAAMGRTYLPWKTDESIRVAAELFVRGSPVVEAVLSWRLRQELKLIIAGGYAALMKQRRLSTMDFVVIVIKWICGRWKPRP